MADSCSITASGTCGTGGWTGADPGDPETSSVYLTATAAYGGIDLNWTYPDINPNAVAYTIIYRSLLPDSDSAAVLVHADGSYYYDKITESSSIYYYWIKIMSIYGTLSDFIGPAWATAKPLIEQTIEMLTGQIDAGVLATSLKSSIAQITTNTLGIDQELIDRAAEDDALGVRIEEVTAYSGDTRALLQEEVLARTSSNEAFVSQVNTWYTTLNGNITAVQTTVTAMQNDVTAMGSKVDNLQTQVDDDIAQLQQTMQVEIDTVNGKVTDISALWTVRMNVNGLASGFGLYSDGSTAEAGFDVDTFWVGRTNANKRKPFIITNDVVYLDEAAINSLTFSKLRDEAGTFIVQNGKIQASYISVDSLIVNNAQSTNYVAGTSGWALKANGTLEINGVVSGYGRMMVTQQYIKVYDTNNVLRVQLGYLNA